MIRTANELQQFAHQLPEWTNTAQPPIDSTALFAAIHALVANGHRRLTNEYEHKRIMLHLDAVDHRLMTNILVPVKMSDVVGLLFRLI